MSPNQLIPTQPYTLTYYITDHTDNNTYYVQARVYDAVTGQLLDTQNLTQQSTNDHLYSKVTQAPGDPSGKGRRIIVVATAYEDSNYTVKSSLYREQSENYIIRSNQNNLGGGGMGIDYYSIREIFKEELLNLIELCQKNYLNSINIIDILNTPEPTEQPTDLTPVFSSIKDLGSSFDTISKNNLDKLIQILTNNNKEIKKGINDSKTDLKPVIDKIEAIKEDICEDIYEIKELMPENEDDTLEKVKELKKLIQDNKVMELLSLVSKTHDKKDDDMESKKKENIKNKINIKDLI